MSTRLRSHCLLQLPASSLVCSMAGLPDRQAFFLYSQHSHDLCVGTLCTIALCPQLWLWQVSAAHAATETASIRHMTPKNMHKSDHR